MTRPRTRPAVAGSLGAVGALASWWTIVQVTGIPPLLLPGPGDVADRLAAHHAYLATATGVTLAQTLAGLALATAGGTGTALLLAAAPRARDTCLPLLVALQNTPKVALAPLLVIWLGYGPASKVALVAVLSYFPVLLNTLTGLRATPTELVDLARTLTASRTRTMRRIRLPYALPHLFTGLKLAASLALIGTVVAQLTTPTEGLGAVISRATQTADTPLAFAAVALLAGCGTGLYYTLAALEHRTVGWSRHTTA